jgi:diguanylate cyclase (GGDEF)-like protein
VREPWAMDAPDGLAGGIPASRAAKPVVRRRDRSADGLARRVLARLPLAVAVIDADGRLSLWNEQAATLFCAPPLMADDRPSLAAMLERVESLSQRQRDRLVDFALTHVTAGDQTEPDGCLRLSLGRSWRISVQIHGLGLGRWMLVLDDGKSLAAGNPAAHGLGDAWLDSLTGLSNRRHFNEMLREALAQATAETRQAVLLIDLDRFAPVNESFGHAVGDALLSLVAQRMRRETRDDDLLARLGGDEFAILIPNGDNAEAVAVRAIGILGHPFLVEGKLVTISASVGIVRIPDHGTSPDDLMRHADLALFEAKSAGGGAWRVFDAAMASEARARQGFETDLRKALALGEFSLVYQPCGDLPTRGLSGFEARTRWDHPVLGLVPDTVFAPVAENNGFIVALGEWELKAACAEAVTWPAGLPVAVRLSSRQWREADRLIEAVRSALAASGLAPARLDLRISEATLQGREAEVLPILHRLRALGVRITLADFAIGRSSMDRLRSFPFHAVALDIRTIPGVGAGTYGAGVLGALSAAGFKHINCYFGDSLTPSSGIADVLRLYAASSNPDAAVE